MEIDDSKSIEITRFVDASEVDPVYFDRTYYLAPARETAAQRPYVLLLRAMQETGKAALGRFVRQGGEHLCLIRPKGDVLALETMFIAEDVNSQAEIEEAVAGSEVKDAELGLAQQVIDSLAGEFDPAGARRASTGRTYGRCSRRSSRARRSPDPSRSPTRRRSSTSWRRSGGASRRSRSRKPARKKATRKPAARKKVAKSA